MTSIYKRGGKGKWLIAYKNEQGKRRVATGTKDKTITKQVAAKLENEVYLRLRGVLNKADDRYGEAEQKALVVKDTEGKIIGGHLADFHAGIVAKGGTEKHAHMVRARVAVILDLCGTERISDLDPAAARLALGKLRDDDLSLQSLNHYMRAAKQFSRWLWRSKRAREDTLAFLSGYNVKLDRRHDRRAMSTEDFGKLVKAAERGPKVLGMTGPDRVILYRLAVATGFRAGELRSLTPESFDLDNDRPTVTVEARYCKRRRRDEQPIRLDLASMLRTWLADKKLGERVFGLRKDKAAKMMRADLQVAGIPYRDSAGLVADFHSLRHSAGTWLKDAKVHAKAIQTFMRHGTITLTMDRYTHPSITDQGDVLANLPPTPAKKPEQVQQIRSA